VSNHTERLGLVADPTTRRALDFIKRQERISASAVIRRLIWREAQRLGFNSSENANDANTTDR
jgi:hypothetical protein